jgi:hypothetical protein
MALYYELPVYRDVYKLILMIFECFLVDFELVNGKVGKISMSAFSGNRKILANGFNTESKLIFIEQIDRDIDLVALSSINKVALFNTRMTSWMVSITMELQKSLTKFSPWRFSMADTSIK